MAKVRVEYTVKAVQHIDWPDSETDCFDYDNLLCNLDPDKCYTLDVDDITDVRVDGKNHDF